VTTLLGTKRGMTQLWKDDGTRVSVTVLDLQPNVVTGVRTEERDGYEALQVGMGAIRPKRLAKAQRRAYEKLEIDPVRHVREVRGPVGEHKVGDKLNVDLFEVGGLIDVVGTSKGKGFAGTIKRHGFARGPTTHGSQNVRGPGSIGMCKYPGRVIKGKKMPGRMGGDRVTIKGLEVVVVDAEANQLLVNGPVPGANGGLIVVRTSNLVNKKGSSES
jgi:large subunit ribosomal protein L3